MARMSRLPVDPAPLSSDPWLEPYQRHLAYRIQKFMERMEDLRQGRPSLSDFASGHEYYGLHRHGDQWIFREWAPNAARVVLVGDFSNWQELPIFELTRINIKGDWECIVPARTISHGMEYRLKVYWEGGCGERLPSYARRVVQDEKSKGFNAQVWSPEPYKWQHDRVRLSREAPLIYEAHIGMAQETEGVGTFKDFEKKVLPRIIKGGYNTIQLMALMEHPYYGSFGYHVSNFFALSSRYGTPEEFKSLVDTAHKHGIRIIMDIVHSHAVKNEVEGIGRFDGTRYQYFHEGPMGYHENWDSYCFDYGKSEVLHFLLSNCRFWLDEYHIDGFRFDGITSMLYRHHGIGHCFTGYDDYFNGDVDEDAFCYLALANRVIHEIKPYAICIAEDVSGMPGLCAPQTDGGCGFDYRMAMGVTDYWYKLFDLRDEDWNMFGLWHELTNRRRDERTISYAECHDQAIVGGKSILFRLVDAEIYYNMHKKSQNMIIDRGIALHKLVRLSTAITSGHGYLNFMGNEFGHPEWIDFPREGNQWSYHHARRQWSVCDDEALRFSELNLFDQVFVNFISKTQLLDKSPVQVFHIGQDEKIIVCERSGYWFVFNFNTQQSFADYAFETLPGKYELVFNTDEERFGGFGRVEPKQECFTEEVHEDGTCKAILKVYVPSATALVFKRVH